MHSTADVLRLVPAQRQHQFDGVTGEVIAELQFEVGKVLIVQCSNGHKLIAPTLDGVSRAEAGDGVAISAWASELAPSFRWSRQQELDFQQETIISVDQTNESFILDSKAVFKWQLFAEESVAAQKELALHHADFANTPSLFGHLWWKDESGQDLLVASLVEYVRDSDDGWTWCPAALQAGETQFAHELGVITARMHAALRGDGGLNTGELAALQLVHGDFHVGQVLKSADSFYIIDFDGDPLLSFEERNQRATIRTDIASMMCSFTHAAMIALKHHPDSVAIKELIGICHENFLAGYSSESGITFSAVELAAITQLMWALEEREVRYATEFLPRWLYAPLGALEYMKEHYER